MEILILWLIIGVIWPMVKKAREQGANVNREYKQFTGHDQTATQRRNQQNPKPKQKGFFDQLKEELEKIEQEERMKNQRPMEQVRKPQTQQAQKEVLVKKMADQLEERRIAESRKKQEEFARRRQEIKEGGRREGPQKEIQPLFDTNYAVRERESDSVEELEQRFPDPAQRMIVYSEILGKPKALR